MQAVCHSAGAWEQDSTATNVPTRPASLASGTPPVRRCARSPKTSTRTVAQSGAAVGLPRFGNPLNFRYRAGLGTGDGTAPCGPLVGLTGLDDGSGLPRTCGTGDPPGDGLGLVAGTTSAGEGAGLGGVLAGSAGRSSTPEVSTVVAPSPPTAAVTAASFAAVGRVASLAMTAPVLDFTAGVLAVAGLAVAAPAAAAWVARADWTGFQPAGG